MFLAFDIYRSTKRQVVLAHLDTFSIESGEVSQLNLIQKTLEFPRHWVKPKLQRMFLTFPVCYVVDQRIDSMKEV